MKIRVTYSDGECRGGVLKLWTLDRLASRVWTNPSDVRETLWKRPRSTYWLLLRLPRVEVTEQDELGDEYELGAVAIMLSPKAAMRWFENKPFDPPDDLVDAASKPFSFDHERSASHADDNVQRTPGRPRKPEHAALDGKVRAYVETRDGRRHASEDIALAVGATVAEVTRSLARIRAADSRRKRLSTASS